MVSDEEDFQDESDYEMNKEVVYHMLKSYD